MKDVPEVERLMRDQASSPVEIAPAQPGARRQRVESHTNKAGTLRGAPFRVELHSGRRKGRITASS